jgi:hypothetical protein
VLRSARPVLAGLGLVVGLVAVVLACQPAAPRASTAQPTQTDPFAVVRATSEASYRSGKEHLDKGELEAALVDLDRARTNDPDNRPDIQQALDDTVRRIQALPPPTAEATATGGARPGALVTPPAVQATAQGQATRPTGATAQPGGTGPAAAQGTSAAAPQTTTGAAAQSTSLVAWRDPQGRFSIGAPRDWQTLDAPPTMFGTGVVGFRDPSGRAELDLAVDSGARAVSSELYAASMELAMQQVPGYALENVQPGTTGGSPSVRRVFTQTRKDPAGREYAARGFQLAIVRGSIAYVVSAFAPVDQYQPAGTTFERMLDTLAFG